MTQTNKNDFIMLPKVDICFKGLMNNSMVRKGFVAAVLEKDPDEIKEIRLLPTMLRQEYANDKLGILDVRVELIDGTQIDMEMQVSYFEYWDARILFYICKMFTEQLEKGDPYEKLKKCMHVSILDFDCFQDEKCCRKVTLCDKETGREYSDLLELHFLELKKLRKEPDEDENELKPIIEWMHFFNGKSREEFRAMANTSKYMDEAYRVLEELSADKRARLEYEAREKAIRDYNSQMSSALRRGFQQGKEQGIQLGIGRGIKQGIEYTHRSLIQKKLEKGKSVSQIAEDLEETEDYIRELLHQMESEKEKEKEEESKAEE